MSARLRQPMFWIVAAEVAVMFALFFVSWRVYESHHPAGAVAAVVRSPIPPAASAEPAAVPPPLPTISGGPFTALTKPPGFPVDVGQLNRDQAALERVENSLLIQLVDAAQAYLEKVVLPSVRRAEKASTTTNPAAAQRPAAIRKIP